MSMLSGFPGFSKAAYADDPLFDERLDVFLRKSLTDVQDFAKREGRPFDEVRLSDACHLCQRD